MVNRSDKPNSFSAQKSPSGGASLPAPGTGDGWIEQTPYVLPNYSGRVPLGASSGINTSVNAGLPAITGNVLLRGAKDVSLITYAASSSSAIWQTTEVWEGSHSALNTTSMTDLLCSRFSIDASRSSAIYGASTTVQPPAVKVAVLIKHD